MSNSSPQQPAAEIPAWLTPKRRLLISAAVAFHLLAVLSWPLAIPSSPITGPIQESLAWYTGPLRLQNGYLFFAPDPPRVSTVVRYEIELQNGETLSRIFPNKQDYVPRLFYHRHLMLTSRLQSLGYGTGFGWGNEQPLRNDGSEEAWVMADRVASGEFPDVDVIREEDYAHDLEDAPPEPRDRLDARRYVRSYAKHLMAKHNAKRVQLFLLEHSVPNTVDMVLEDGVALDAPESYRQSLLIDLREGER